jgi:CheY-like chemotaxis protein
VRDTTRRLLERAGWQVVTAEDGEAGWLAFERARPALAAVVTDLRMPRLDGAQLAARIRAHDGQLPIVFVSGYEESRDDVPPLAGTRFLRKPFAIDELTAVLDAVAPAA